VIAALARVASRLNVPYPVFLVLGGLAIGFVPGLPEIELEPDVVLLVFLPPLVYYAAFVSSPRMLRAHVRSIGLLSVGLVLTTLVIVALVAHEIVGSLTWAEAFALGAILGPTDPVAATTVFRRLGAPERLTTIVEGEALVNDGTGLAAFRVAAGAITAGSISALEAGGQFFLSGVGGVLIGLAAAWLVTRVRRSIDDPPVEIALSLFTPYLAYLPADRLHTSGVLAAVTAGLFLAWQVPTGMFHAASRLQALAFWDVLMFLLNSLLFVLVGLQVQPVLEELGGERSALSLLGAALAVVAAVVLTRLAWTWFVDKLAGLSGPERLILGWCGMRGAVSLAAALAVPAEARHKPLMLFLTFAVILVTIVGQGLTLPTFVRRLAPDETGDREAAEHHARLVAARAALERLDDLQREHSAPEDALEHARRRYEIRLNHLEDGEDEEALPSARRLLRSLAETERETIERLHIDGELDQATARRLERELDLEEARLSEMER